jgi:hypothetical protein
MEEFTFEAHEPYVELPAMLFGKPEIYGRCNKPCGTGKCSDSAIAIGSGTKH